MYKIYALISPNKKYYIGQTKQDITTRFKQHINSYNKWIKLDKPRKSYNTKLFYAFDKYNPKLWEIVELTTANTQYEINHLEKENILKYNSINDGYNIQKGGQGWTIEELSEQHKKNISLGRKEWFKTDEGIEWKEKIKQIFKNNPRKNLTAWNKGIKMKELYPNMYENVIRSENSRSKQSESMKKAWKNGKYNNRPKLSKESIEKARQSNIGKKRNEKQKNNISKSLEETFIITDPSGKEFEITNLRKWCINNNLDQGNLSKVLSGKLKQSKGYKIRRP